MTVSEWANRETLTFSRGQSCAKLFTFPLSNLGGGLLYSNIYVITNGINNKQYVGQSVNVEKRWYSHIYNSLPDSNIYLYNAMKKHGINNFSIKLIESNIPLEEINTREEYWIKKLNTFKPNGYNLTLGGEGTKGYKMSDETKNKISTIAKERYKNLSESQKQEMINRLPKDGYDLDKMNKGYKNWLSTSPESVIKERSQKAVKTKKEKGYDFYNFSFGKMSAEDKDEMYKTISKNNPRSQGICMLDEYENIIKEFHSVREASRYLHENFNVSINSKSRLLKVLDTNNKAYGYKWKRK